MSATEVKSDFKSKANGAGKSAKSTMDDVMDSAPEVISKVAEFGKSFLHNMSDSREKAMEVATHSLESVDKSVKEKPWTFVGGAAILGFVAGFLLGRGRSPESALASNIKSNVDKIKNQIEKNINKVSEHLQ